MQKNLILTLLFSIVIAVFAILNAAPIRVNLIFAKVNISAALVILISAALGALLIFSIDILSKIKGMRQIKQLEKKLEASEATMQQLKAQYDDLLKSQKDDTEGKPPQG